VAGERSPIGDCSLGIGSHPGGDQTGDNAEDGGGDGKASLHGVSRSLPAWRVRR